jgi:hypothetical protein
LAAPTSAPHRRASPRRGAPPRCASPPRLAALSHDVHLLPDSPPLPAPGPPPTQASAPSPPPSSIVVPAWPYQPANPTSMPRRRLSAPCWRLIVVSNFVYDLQADKSPVVVKGPFFPRVVNPRYRIHGTNVWRKSWSSKAK